MSRDYNAEYYDAFTTDDADIKFYQSLVNNTISVLELGCGSGRVTSKLVNHAKEIIGVDNSYAMLEQARKKLEQDGILYHNDITTLELTRKFDLIIAPFRVFQCLEHEQQINQFFNVVQNHLSEDGTAILNVFNPFATKQQMATKWPQKRTQGR